jgi:hypothetical protein
VKPGEFLASDIIVINIAIGIKRERTRLQLCEWHTIKAIRKRLINKGYSKETREVLVNLLNQWVKALDLETLEKARNKILSRL